MGTKGKGIFKGLKHLSHIFDEREDEIKIGFPTDVKHVAHIGSDGPSTNQPSWMNGFKDSESSSQVDSIEVLSSQGSTKTISEGHEPMIKSEIPKARRKSSSTTISSPFGSPKRGSDGSKNSRRSRNKDKENSIDVAGQESSSSTRGSSRPKHSRQNRSVDSSNDPTIRDLGSTQGSSDESKTSRRNQSVDGSTNSPTKESSKRSSRRNRSVDISNDHSSTKDSSSITTRQSKTLNAELVSSSQDQPVIPKQSRRKKSDGRRSSRSKEQGGSLTNIHLDLESKNNET